MSTEPAKQFTMHDLAASLIETKAEYKQVFSATFEGKPYGLVSDGHFIALRTGDYADCPAWAKPLGSIEGWQWNEAETHELAALREWCGKPDKLKKCKKCEATGKKKCESCYGKHKYVSTCSCGHEHDHVCPRCKDGTVNCWHCGGDGRRVRKTDRLTLRSGVLRDQPINQKLLASVLRAMPNDERVGISSHNAPGGAVRIDGDGWLVILMGLRMPVKDLVVFGLPEPSHPAHDLIVEHFQSGKVGIS